jgi:hypothetical protein
MTLSSYSIPSSIKTGDITLQGLNKFSPPDAVRDEREVKAITSCFIFSYVGHFESIFEAVAFAYI